MAASNVTNSTPVYTRLVDDSSPLLLFEPASAWNHTAGPGPNLYVNSTYSSSDISGATCKFSFNGTGFWVMGAKKANYGQYLILVDDAVQVYANATAPQTQFGQVLGGASGLEDGSHTVVFMAAGGGPVDVDAIVYERTDMQQNGTHSGVQTAPLPSSSSSPTASVSSLSSSHTASVSSSSGSHTASASSSLSSHATSVSSSSTSQTAPSSSSSSGNRISANPNAQGPNEPIPSQNASAAPTSSPQSATLSASSTSTSTVSSATASSSGPLPSQPSAQPSEQDSTAARTDAPATAHQGVQPTAQPNAQPSAQPSPSQPVQSSMGSALGPSVSQAEHANSPQIAGTSQTHKGLPLGATIGIGVAAAVAVLCLIALLFCLMRRRRRAATARRRMTAGLPSPALPLQDPARQGNYFFGGYGNSSNGPGPTGGNGMRELYLAQGAQNSYRSGVAAQGRAAPYRRDADTLKPVPPAVIRDSVYTNADTATLGSEDGYITDASSSSRTVPIRPPRPPDLRLSVV